MTNYLKRFSVPDFISQKSVDYNIGFEMVKCYALYFDHHEKKLHDLIDKLAKSNIEIKIISDVMNKLSHAKQKDKKADFTKDATMKRYITHIHKNNPTIFENLIKGFPEHLPAEDQAEAAAGKEITLEDVLNDSLKSIDMSKIKIDVLTEEQIDVIVQGLDGQLKMHSADLNESMMKINENYDNRSQMTENARQVVKQSGDLLESINRKMAG
jgi:flagellar hook-basal body complex protein FliE